MKKTRSTKGKRHFSFCVVGKEISRQSHGDSLHSDIWYMKPKVVCDVDYSYVSSTNVSEEEARDIIIQKMMKEGKDHDPADNKYLWDHKEAEELIISDLTPEIKKGLEIFGERALDRRIELYHSSAFGRSIDKFFTGEDLTLAEKRSHDEERLLSSNNDKGLPLDHFGPTGLFHRGIPEGFVQEDKRRKIEVTLRSFDLCPVTWRVREYGHSDVAM